LDLKDFYIGTPVEKYEYMRLHISNILNEIINKYNLRAIVDNHWVYIKVHGGKYGLRQAGKPTHNLLQQRPSKHGYAPIPNTPAVWKHKIRPIMSTF
jgi:hypothetical protein